MKRTTPLFALFIALAVGLSACSDESNLTGMEESAEGAELSFLATNPNAEGVLAIDYDAQNNIYVAVVENDGQIDVYTGQHNAWSKLQENRDIDNRYSPSEFVDFSIGDGEAMYGVAVGNKGGQCTSINAREFYEKPWFGDGVPQPIGTLEQCLSIDYDADNDKFVVVGVAGGEIDVYTGQHNAWSKLQENRDIDSGFGPGEFVDFSIGQRDSDKNFSVAIGNRVIDVDPRPGSSNRDLQQRCLSTGGREFSGKVYHGDNSAEQVGEDLVECLSIDYDADNDNFYVVGKNTSGEIDVWYGTDEDWTKLQENRDIDNRYSPSEFVDFSIGDGEAMFGVAVGNKDGQPTSINAREFSNKPYFGDGRPEPIN